jgi:plasmid stability protein
LYLEETMAQVLVRDLEEKVLERLKERARNHGRALQAELKIILKQAAPADMVEARDLARKIRRMLAGRRHSSAAELVAEDRRR